MCIICKHINWPWDPDAAFSHIAVDSWEAATARCPYLLEPSVLHSSLIFRLNSYHWEHMQEQPFFLIFTCIPQYNQPFTACSGALPLTSWRTHPGRPWYKISCSFRFILQQHSVWGSGTFQLAPLTMPAAKSSQPQQSALDTSPVKRQVHLQLRVPLIQELKEQTNDGQFTWVSGEQYSEIYMSDST